MDDFDIDILAEFNAAAIRNQPEVPVLNFPSTTCVNESPIEAFISNGKEKDTFGFISKAEYYGDIFTCEEAISDYNARVFWNKKTNEVIKLLGNKVFMHYDAEHRGRFTGHIETIPESVVISVGLDPSKLEFFNLFKPSDSDLAIIEQNISTTEEFSDDCTRNSEIETVDEFKHIEETRPEVVENQIISSKSCECCEFNLPVYESTIKNPIRESISLLGNENQQQRSMTSVKDPFVGHAPPSPILSKNVNSYNQYTKVHKASVLSQREDILETRVALAMLQQKYAILQQENEKLKQHNIGIMSRFNEYINEIERLKQENKTIQDNFKYINDCYNKLHEEYEIIKSQLNTLRNMYNNAKIEFSRPTYEKVLAYFDSCNSDKLSVTQLCWLAQKEMFINSHYNPGNRKYSIDTKKFYWVISSQSFSSYQTLREVFPIPCYNTLNNFMKQEIIETECAILDIKYIPSFVDKFLSRYTTTVVGATLAVDALVVTPKSITDVKNVYNKESHKLLRAFNTQLYFRESNESEPINDVYNEINQKASQMEETPEKHFKKVQDSNKDEKLNNVFIFYIEPLNPQIPCFPVHLWLQHGGSANKTVRALTSNIIAQVNGSGMCKIKRISTDGDLGHQTEYKDALNKILAFSKTLNIKEISKELEILEPLMASADMLHFLKTLRIKILIHILCLVPYRLSTVFDINTLGDLFGTGREMTDLTHIGKMRDVYPILFFSLRNLLNLKRKAIWSGVLLFTPWTLWIAATLNTAFTTKARLFMLNISYEIIIRIYNLSLTKEPWLSTVSEKASESKSFLTFVSKNVLERIIPTFVTLITSLQEFVKIVELIEQYQKEEKALENENDKGDIRAMKEKVARLHAEIETKCSHLGLPYDLMIDFAFDRFVTHPLENFNGNIRDVAHSNDTIDSTSHIVARAHVQKCLKHVCTRINAGGIRLSASLNQIDSPDIDPAEIAESLFVMADGATKETMLKMIVSGTSIQQFFEFISIANKVTEEKKMYAIILYSISIKKCNN